MEQSEVGFVVDWSGYLKTFLFISDLRNSFLSGGTAEESGTISSSLTEGAIEVAVDVMVDVADRDIVGTGE